MRDKQMRAMLHKLAVVAFVFVCASTASAQLPSPSTRALGMGDNYTAAAHGYAAPSWNPALLALPTPAQMSIAILTVRGVAGLNPIGLGDLNDFQGEYVPSGVRERWLRDIERTGSQTGSAGGDATYVAAHFGRIGVQAASTLRVAGNLSPGAAELLFFGNAGRTGEPRALHVKGSAMRAHAASTFALSYALPVHVTAGRVTTVGVTAKYTIGHMLLLGHGHGAAAADAASIEVAFPVLRTNSDQLNARAGAGVGFDVGAATRSRSVTLAANIHNLLNTFDWDAAQLEFRDGLAQFDETTTTSAFDAFDYASAPAELKQEFGAAKFARTLSLGGALDASPRLKVTSDLRVRLSRTTLAESPAYHAGAGAEYQLLSRVLVRGGGAVIADGYQVAGGVGLSLGPVSVSASIMRRHVEYGSATVSMVSLFSMIGE